MNKEKKIKFPIISLFKGNECKAFTLVETMVGILIFTIIIIGGFKAYSGVLIGKVKLIEGVNVQKQSFFFGEKFFEELKKGGTIDYEEYFNRKVVGTTTGSGHYNLNTGFGNQGTENGFYYCRSGNGENMGSGTLNPDLGCVKNNFNNSSNTQSGSKQRFGQYSFQFIDYNSNYDDDKYNGSTLLGDEDGNGKIIGDDDDEYLGFGPVAFSGSEVKEIYLISADKRKRTIFRYSTFPDEIKPSENRGTIEFLKLEGKDWGFDHDTSNADKKGEYDGVVDTWIIDPDFTGGTEIVAGSTLDTGFWQPLFGENVNVKSVKFFLYPNKDRELAFQDPDPKININPYVRIQMILEPSNKARRGFKGKIPEVKINTTVNLTDIYSR